MFARSKCLDAFGFFFKLGSILESGMFSLVLVPSVALSARTSSEFQSNHSWLRRCSRRFLHGEMDRCSREGQGRTTACSSDART